jgi:hypothetical protein
MAHVTQSHTSLRRMNASLKHSITYWYHPKPFLHVPVVTTWLCSISSTLVDFHFNYVTCTTWNSKHTALLYRMYNIDENIAVNVGNPMWFPELNYIFNFHQTRPYFGGITSAYTDQYLASSSRKISGVKCQDCVNEDDSLLGYCARSSLLEVDRRFGGAYCLHLKSHLVSTVYNGKDKISENSGLL